MIQKYDRCISCHKKVKCGKISVMQSGYCSICASCAKIGMSTPEGQKRLVELVRKEIIRKYENIRS